MPVFTRRRFLALTGAAGLGVVAVRLGLPALMRRGVSPPPLTARSAAFVEDCFAGIDRARVWDGHAHLIGLGAGGTGCGVHPSMQSHLHPIRRFQFDLYRAGTGMTRDETADADYLAGLLHYHRAANPTGRLVLLAFDRVVDEDGRERADLSAMFTPNEYVLRVAAAHPELVACASIHPYRSDAVERLDRAAAAGARAVKWLPNAMGIDPASPRCDPFLRRLAELDLPLITHAGKEFAVHAGGGQDLGNPLRVRRALDHGVRVIVAHCAALGSYPDLDRPAAGRADVPSFELFMRLFAGARAAPNLYGDISAITQINYGLQPIRELLRAPELHERLVYGSDYPLPALRFLISPRRFERNGLLTGEQRRLCSELFWPNPLLFDFAIKRCLQLESEGRTYRFSPAVFESARVFAVSRGPRAARGRA